MSTTATPGYNDPTSYSATPGSGSYGILQSQAENAYASSLNQINTQRTSFLNNQGLTGQYDATTGNFTGTSVDANNQGGAYQQMENSNAGQGAADSAAINQLGFGGGLQAQQQEAAQKGYSQNAANWALGAGAGLQGYGQQGVDAQATAGSTLYSGLVSDIQNAIGAGNFNPANYTNVDIPGQGKLSDADIASIAAGLGYKPGGTTPPPTGTGTLGGGSGGSAHPQLAQYNLAHPNNKMTLAQWQSAAGHQGRR